MEPVLNIIRAEGDPQEIVGGSLFPGGRVTRQTLARGSDQLSLTLLNFETGARNAFHIHTHDQVVLVLSGTGIVATMDETREVTAGDVVLFPAGENHWHAASPDSGVAFVSITPAGTTTAVV